MNPGAPVNHVRNASGTRPLRIIGQSRRPRGSPTLDNAYWIAYSGQSWRAGGSGRRRKIEQSGPRFEQTAKRGITADWPQWEVGQRHARRLAAVAERIGRTPAAVHKRAQRIGEYSYLDHQRIRERRPVNQAEPNQANQPEPDADAREARRIMVQIRKVTG